MTAQDADSVATRILVFDGQLSQEQAESVKQVYRLLFTLPPPVQRAIARDLALHNDGEVSA